MVAKDKKAQKRTNSPPIPLRYQVIRCNLLERVAMKRRAGLSAIGKNDSHIPAEDPAESVLKGNNPIVCESDGFEET